ncbi:hypothetical protein F5X96DRAFT_620082 [Biscogniauxia mediterranea]|nr:hypothetical protein F5X96DRAFT_620082 [Biscogniauxia mediterranea]
MWLFVNAVPITRMIGLREVEAQMLLEFLMRRVVTGHDFQARVNGAPNSDVMLDYQNTRPVARHRQRSPFRTLEKTGRVYSRWRRRRMATYISFFLGRH